MPRDAWTIMKSGRQSEVLVCQPASLPLVRAPWQALLTCGCAVRRSWRRWRSG